MSIHDRGFASMPKERRHAAAVKGGKAVHEKGTAHQWSAEEAREASRKAALARARRRAEQTAATASDAGASV